MSQNKIKKSIYTPISSFMDHKLQRYPAGFHKNYNTQHAIPKLTETRCSTLNKGNKVGAIVMEFSKAFDTLNQYLFLCKLKADSFDKNALTVIQSYFPNRHQKTKLGDKFSKWQKISIAMPQVSILGLLFFNIFISDLFLFIETTTLCYYADDNTIYSSVKKRY